MVDQVVVLQTVTQQVLLLVVLLIEYADTSTAVPTQGYGGGNRGPQPHAPYYNGAGGGGAGAAGADQNNNTFPGSFGGNGKRTTITGPAYTIGTPGPASAGGTGGGDSTAVTGGWLSGGGGGGLYQYSPTASLPQTRGAGGGGAGGNGGSVVDATDAVASTGGGGGGSGHSGRVGGAGGSGIVVIRYQIGELVAPQNKATGGSITSYAPNDPSPMAEKPYMFSQHLVFLITLQGHLLLEEFFWRVVVVLVPELTKAQMVLLVVVLEEYYQITEMFLDHYKLDLLLLEQLHIQLLLVPVVLRAHLEHPPIHSLMDRLELVLLLEPQLQHLAVVEVLLVQVKMVKMVDLVVVHQVADQLGNGGVGNRYSPTHQITLAIILILKTKVNLVVKEMLHQSITMVLAVVVDSLKMVKAVVMVVVTEVLVLIYQ